MRSMEDALLLRIFLGEEDMADGKPLYRAILETAMKAGLAGGTVLRAPMGFGISRSVRTGIRAFFDRYESEGIPKGLIF